MGERKEPWVEFGDLERWSEELGEWEVVQRAVKKQIPQVDIPGLQCLLVARNHEPLTPEYIEEQNKIGALFVMTPTRVMTSNDGGIPEIDLEIQAFYRGKHMHPVVRQMVREPKVLSALKKLILGGGCNDVPKLLEEQGLDERRIKVIIDWLEI